MSSEQGTAGNRVPRAQRARRASRAIAAGAPAPPARGERAPWHISAAVAVSVASVMAVLASPAVALVSLVVALLAVHFLGTRAEVDHLARRLALFAANPDREPGAKVRRFQQWTPVIAFAIVGATVAAAWEQSDPDQLWNAWAALVACGGAWSMWAFVQWSRSTGQPCRWWPAWLAMVVLVGSFLTAGGPFRIRWAYCKDRLTEAAQAGEGITIGNTGRFCWHEATEVVVSGQLRLYITGGVGENDDGSRDLDGSGLVYSPDRRIELAPRMRLLRDLGGGWYYFESGSIVRDIWFDG